MEEKKKLKKLTLKKEVVNLLDDSMMHEIKGGTTGACQILDSYFYGSCKWTECEHPGTCQCPDPKPQTQDGPICQGSQYYDDTCRWTVCAGFCAY